MKLAILALTMAAACTTLGPMPATTGISAIPQARTGAEVQAGLVPGFHLSSAVQEDTHGEALKQISALFDLAAIAPGVLVGARAFGDDGDTIIEPYAGYRTKVSDLISVGGVAFGTANRSGDNGASYFATRVGAEVMADVELFAFTENAKVHAQLSGGATRIAARGTYCSSGRFGTDCDDNGSDQQVTTHISGVYPSGTAQLSLDLARRPHGEIHNVSLAFMLSAGTMPKVESGKQIDNASYTSAGLLLTVGLGDD